MKYHVPIVFSSSEKAGAVNKSSDGSSFQIRLERPILIPKNSKHCWVVCQAAEIWNTSPNIITGVNDKLYFEDSIGVLTLTIPEGLYGVSELNEEVGRQLVENGRTIDAIAFLANSATSKVIISIAEIGASVNFTPNDTFREILGFESILIVTTTANETIDASSNAQFNQIDFFILHTDLVSHGIRINDRFTQAVAQVLIEAEPGNQIIHQPQNPPEIPSAELIGEKKTLINVWLTDQNNNRVSTAGEDYTMRLMIYYII